MTAKDKNDQKPSISVKYTGVCEYLIARKDKIKVVAIENEKKN
jgi:hypothetical protein